MELMEGEWGARPAGRPPPLSAHSLGWPNHTINRLMQRGFAIDGALWEKAGSLNEGEHMIVLHEKHECH